MTKLGPTILTIESTCDETAAAIVDGALNVLGSCVASQHDLHKEFRGVVPEIAARAHSQRILPVLETTLRQSQLKLADLDAIAVATTPGLANSLLVGLVAAKTLAVVLDKPLIAINHIHAHIYACRFVARPAPQIPAAVQSPQSREATHVAAMEPADIYPCVGLVVSGGHTHLYHYSGPLTPRLLGGTIDDAAGEAFDKVAAMLQLGFPGGPAVSRAAESGDPAAHKFPRSYLRDEQIRFSFSGLKTAVRYAIAEPGSVDFSQLELSEKQVADVAASFEAAVVEVLVAKSLQAIRQTGVRTLCVGGGVAANRRLRTELTAACDQQGVRLVIAPPGLCTDNAVMGSIAREHFLAGQFDSLEIDIHPGLVR